MPLKIKFLRITLILLFALSLSAYTIQHVSAQNLDKQEIKVKTENIEPYDDNFFEAGLLTFTLFMIIGFFILVLLGIAIGTLILLAILGLGFIGIISSSILIGLYKKSFETGFKLFAILGFGFVGMIFSSIVFSFLNFVLKKTLFEYAFGVGTLIGLIAGLLSGLIVFRILKYLLLRYKNNLDSEV